MAELRSAIFWVLNCPIYLLRCYISHYQFTKVLPHFCELKPNPKSRKILKVLQSNTFKIFLVVRLIVNCCNKAKTC
ncbi:MAG: hypothetical protein IM597_09700 [Pseudanabaena sp. M176S2SP2A07QC]|nr:hypothetical protein [Pseudanabaena sp. M090S1SP2A07QC]MCA6505720.1 hypothetical protein [Pseudanabaena sp. M172S2SP2A07QC]MCA6521936.1 hypothetical protein [Pseudanabaena sp. M051S1SP2A07QC]MCA6524483.1 hypothetical protein [Pseudanabaena sp. M179S2SP2A07QC]MCA6534424.1 hypothetical protein [Pseudanabaena sp. M176S2SP2A07QC]MCA6539475.1 hypothetical protein [Pseudanabaena sp. M037S2SP2A07QC]MCA6560363.1 hypothetical protein [Pseudanabaena sp. M079S1SP2A07QC]MCA6563619.1 hypothetical prot